MTCLNLHRVFALAAVLFPVSALAAAQDPALPQPWADAITWRSIGPANMGGRITAIAVNPNDTSMWWAASASGGLLKTVNNGADFTHQFDHEATVSIGDVQVSASNPDIVWVGTGESNPRNSVSWGDGVYKSTDGGKTWKNMGLKQSFQIGRIAIHPTDPNIVYVGALGRLWGPNEERGLYKTTDGGEKWERVHFVDDKTGVIDVQMNPKNPDELIFATYERQRDGYDGNDPAKRFGPGAGIWKTTDAGKTFERLTNGLPSCNLGRIGLDVWDRDPRYVIAVIESEKIAKLPETAPFIGLRGEDANVGARVTAVTEDSPAAKAGILVDDIVIRADGQLVLSYNRLLAAVRKHQAGEKVKLELSRSGDLVTLEVELDKMPEGNRGNNPFTGTLGGQAENLQDQQGPEGKEYGGVYLSKDGGKTWERINTLNPRPMYYSQIRFDPTDRDYVYLLGTDLYRSFDGGKTFKDDGVTDGIHVDHHALWIDPKNGKHMILGNDGGVFVTWDRMENWDHHNQFAIGQFYHADVDSRADYKVYGGLQDNGSWGGPMRSGRDRGPVNTDWYSVGGGDGFITTVDPDDPDQIYFESQNGGMGRINLRTGERGFIRPRPPRGTQYRFNWKTPYILSPHNSRIFYAAGNHVFQSLNKGDNIRAISPELTNSRNGSGSALSESAVEAGVIYAGFTDGALWVTKDGGKNWDPIFHKPVEEAAAAGGESESGGGEAGGEAAAEGGGEAGEGEPGRRRGGGRRRPGREGAEGGPPGGREGQPGEMREGEPAPVSPADQPGDKPAEETDKPADKPAEVPAGEEAGEAAADPVSGSWVLTATEDEPEANPLDGLKLDLKLSAADGVVTGMLVGRRGEYEIRDGKYEAEKKKLTAVTTTPLGDLQIELTFGKDGFEGTATGDDDTSLGFTGKKADDGSARGSDLSALELAPVTATHSLVAYSPARADALRQDPENVNGLWTGTVESEELPGGKLEFTIEVTTSDTGEITGSVDSVMGTLSISDAAFKPETGKFVFVGRIDDAAVDFEATVKGDEMSGSVVVGDEGAELPFTARREKQAEPEPAEEKPAEAMPGEPAQPAGDVKPPEQEGQKEAVPSADAEKAAQEPAAEKPAEEKPAEAAQEPATVKPASPLAGKWTGRMISDQAPRGGMGEFTMTLAPDDKGNLTGTFETQRGDSPVSEAKVDEKGKVSIVAENERFTITFEGILKEKKLTGTVDFGGNFSMDFEAERTGDVPAAGGAADAGAAQAAGSGSGKKLEELLPGPRWVSSLSASRFKAGRVYASFNGHRSNDDDVHVYVSEDYGQTWASVRGNLPKEAGSVECIREDRVVEDILYVGCEFSAWVSIDRGQTWTRFGGLPTVAVHEFAQHASNGDIVAATHGRSLWVANVTALRQFTADKVREAAVLYKPATAIRWQREASAGDTGPRRFVGQNPADGATIHYSLGRNAASVELTITGSDGRLVRRYSGLPATQGLHSVAWDLREELPTGAPATGGGPGGGGRGGGGPGGGGGGGGGGGRRIARTAPSGIYQLSLRVDNAEFKQVVEVATDPDLPADATAEALELETLELDEDREEEENGRPDQSPVFGD